MAYVFYESGLSDNVMYGIKDGEKRAVGFKLSEGMEVPGELASRFKFARQKSKLVRATTGAHQAPSSRGFSSSAGSLLSSAFSDFSAARPLGAGHGLYPTAP
jgi:hypothetical protein